MDTYQDDPDLTVLGKKNEPVTSLHKISMYVPWWEH